MIRNFSKYRNQLMGAMILWVMFFHTNMSVSSAILVKIKSLGYGGVDGFIFLAGMGAFYSLNKNRDTLSYYKRRLIKLLPTYYPILALWLIFTIWTERPQNVFGVIFGNITGQAFWNLSSLRFNWYIEAIWIFYGLAPFIFYLINLSDRRYIRIFFIFLLLMNTAYFDMFTLIAISRLPIFVFGIYAGKRLCEEYHVSKTQEIISYGCGIVGLLLLYISHKYFPDTLWKYGMHWHPFMLIIPGFFSLLCHIFILLDKIRCFRPINGLLGEFGKCSFELYLIHVFFFEGLQRNNSKVLVLSIISAFLYRYIITKICAIYKTKTAQKNTFTPY